MKHLIVFVAVVLITQTIKSQMLNKCTPSNKYLPVPLWGYQLAYFEQNSTVYIFGGYSQELWQMIYKWDLNNISTEPLFKPINTTTPTHEFVSVSSSVAVIDNYAYFIGISDHNVTAGKIYRFDINTESFASNFTKMPIGAAWGCLSNNGTHIFMIGGSQYADIWNVTLNITQVYDIKHDKWSTYPLNISPINETGIQASMCIMLNNTLYVFGGNSKRTVYTSIYKVEWPGNVWTYLGNLPTPLTAGAVVNHCNVNIIISGGIKDEHGWVSDRVYIFNINASKIIDSEYTIVPNAEWSAIIIDAKMYIFGGRNNNAATEMIQVCTLDNSVCGASNTSKVIQMYWIFIVGGILIVSTLIYSLVCSRKRRTRLSSTDSDDPGMIMIGK